MPKTNAEICRAYYQRKKLARNKIKKIPLSSTERVRNFRARQRELRECALNIHNFGSSTSELLTRDGSFESNPFAYSAHNQEELVDKSSDTIFFEPEIEIKEEISCEPFSVCGSSPSDVHVEEETVVKGLASRLKQGEARQKTSPLSVMRRQMYVHEGGLNILPSRGIKEEPEKQACRLCLVSSFEYRADIVFTQIIGTGAIS